MVAYQRIGPDGAFVREIGQIRESIKSIQSKPAGNIVIREQLLAEDPDTGVKTIIGQLPDGTTGFQPFVGDITPPPVATTPVVSAQPGVFTVSWDGLFVNNEDKPRDFEHVNVIGHKIVSGAVALSVEVGVIRLSTESVIVTQDIATIGEVWQFSLESEDYNGNKAARGTKSDPLTMLSAATDEGVNAALQEINLDVISTQSAAASAQSAADKAQKAADDAAKAASDAAGVASSKSKVLIQSSAPAAADQNANVLWIDTTNGLNAPKRWSGSAWVVVTDKAATDAAAAAAAAQTRADQAFNSAQSAATAAGQAQTTADGKNTSYYLPAAPTGTGFKTGDQWFDTANGYRLKVWNGAAWITAQDSALAQQTADSKALVYTQATVPPTTAQVASTVWYDTSLGLDKIVQKYWNGVAWTALADKTATDAAAVAATKTKTYFQPTQPALTGNTTGDLWFDTANGNKPYVWNGAWTVAQDSTVTKSLFSSFSTDIDNTQPNKWLFTRYNKTMQAAAIPGYLDVAGFAGTSSLVADGTNIVMNVGDGYVGQLRTIVNVVSAKTIAFTGTHDDAAQIYVDGVSVYTKSVYTQNAPISFSLSAGWHVLDFMWAEISGGDGWFAISPTISSQVTSMFAPVSMTALSTAVSAAQTSADSAATSAQNAMNAQSYSINASFDDWTGTTPAGYSAWTNGPVKETVLFRKGPFAARFNVPDATTGYGLQFSSILSHAPNLEYFTVELDFYLVSGSLGAAGFLLDWTGLTNNRAQFNLATEVPNAVTGKWYRVSKVLRRPTNSTGTWTNMSGYLMGQYTSLGTGAAKNIVFDWMNVRPSTTEEILAYSAPADAQAKADAAKAAAIAAAASDATTKADSAEADAILAAATDAQNKAAAAQAAAISAAATDATNKANQAKADALTAAATDAKTKADAAQAAAITAAAADAKAKADAAQAAATSAAAADAKAKADAAQQAAIDAAAATAQLKADGAEADAIAAAAADAKTKADAAQAAAITAAAADAKAKADAAQAAATAAAATDAQTRADQAKADAISAAALDATAKSDAAQMAAIQAQAYQLNPSFEDWTGTIPANYTTFVTNPTKETTTVRTGKYAVRFNCTDATTQRGLQFNAALAHAPYFEYLTVELDVRLDSGSSFGGAGVLVDWGGMTGANRATISLATEIPAPVTGRWYRMVKVIRKPSTATGTFTSYSAWLMGQYGTGMGTQAIKNVIFDWINVRPATNEEITAYGTPASIQSLSDTVNTKTKTWFQPTQPPLTGNTAGDQWFDTSNNNKVYIWNGTWAVASDQRIEALNTSVSSIQTTANGKNKVIYSTSAASGTTGYVAGDTWFQRDASNNIIAQWEFTTSWQTRKVDDAMIANLNAAKIIAGTLDAQRIGANTIGVSKLMVSDMEEFIPNPFFHPAGEPVTQGTIVTTANTPVSAGAPYPNAVLFNSRDNHPFSFPNIPVKPGDQFYLEVWVASAATAIRNFNLYMFGATVPSGGLTAKVSTGNLVPGTTWRKVTWAYTVPTVNPGFQYIRPVLQINNVGGETAAQMEWYATGFSMKRKNTGELIVDGAIKAGSAIIDNLAVSNAQIADLAISTAKIQNLAVKTAQIDDLAVTDGKITSLNAGKITAGYLDARVIAAGSIKADKLDVTLGGSNLVTNSSFEVDTNNDGLADNWNTWARGAGDASRTFANTRPAGLFPGSTYAQRVTSNNVSNIESSSIQSSTLFSIAPGASATLSLYGRASVAGSYSISIRCEDDTAAYMGDAAFIAAFTTTAQRFVGTVIIPAGTTRGKVTITTPTSLTSGHWFEVDGIKAELGNIVSAWSPMTSELLPGTIVGTMLSATAIDGMVVTGATIQTTATASRGIKLTSTEFAGYDAVGTKNFSLTSAGALTLKGDITSGSTITGATVTGSTVQTEATAARGIKLTTTELAGYDTAGVKNFSLTTGGTLAIKGDITAGSTITGATVTGSTVQTTATVSRGIKLTTTELAGYDNAGTKNFSLLTDGTLSVRGSIESGSVIKGATLSAGTGGIESNSAVNRGVKLKDTGILAYDSTGNLTFNLDATTGYLELPGLKANSVNGDRITAGTLTTDKLIVGDMTNFVLDPYMSGTGKISGVTYLSSNTQTVSAGAPFEKLIKANVRDITEAPAQYRPVTGGEVYYAEAWVRADATAAKNIYLGMWSISDDNSNHWNTTSTLTPTTDSWTTPAAAQAGWVKLRGTFVIPTTVAAGKPTTKARAWIQVNGTTGTDTQGWYITGWNVRRQENVTTIQDGTITTAKVVASGIDAGVLTAGTLRATLIGSKSITTDKLVVSSTNNLVVEADFGNTGASWGVLDTNKFISPATGRNGLPSLRVTGNGVTQTISNLVNRVTVGTEDRFRGSLYMKASSAAPSGAVKLFMKAYSTATSSVPVLVATSQAVTAGTWTLVEGYSNPFPNGVTSVEFYLEVTNTPASATIDIDYVAVTRAADAKLVVDGAIDGKVITGATIQTASPALSGARIVLDSTGLRGWDASNKQYISATANGLAVTGSLGATGDGVDYAVYNNGVFGVRPVYVGIGGAAGQVGLGVGGQTWPYPSPLTSGTAIPGIIFKPTSVPMYDLTSITARDGVTVSMQRGVTQAEFDTWANTIDSNGQLVNARKSYMPTIMTLNVDGVNFSKYVEAPEYRIGGTSLSTASVVTYTASGTLNNQALTKLANYTRRDDASTDTFLFTLAANGYDLVARDTGVYDIFVQYALGGPVQGRSFVEVVQNSDTYSGARSFFTSGEDTTSVTLSGIKITAGQTVSINGYAWLGSPSIAYGITVRMTKKAAPLPVKSWGEGTITQTGDVIVQGDMLSKPHFAQFYSNNFVIAGGSTPWDSGTVTEDTSKSRNNNFAVRGPYAGSVTFTQSGWYQISHFMIPIAGSPMDTWNRLFLGSTMENLVQDGNRPAAEMYLSTIPIYIAAGDYVRSTVVSPGGFTANTTWKIVKFPWSA